MSQREFMIILAHTHACSACRGRLLDNPAAMLGNRALTSAEKETLQDLKYEDYLTPDTLSAPPASPWVTLTRTRIPGW